MKMVLFLHIPDVTFDMTHNTQVIDAMNAIYAPRRTQPTR